MITTYTINDASQHNDLMKLIIDPTQIEEDGSFTACELSNINDPSQLQGFIFIIDKNTAEQLDKIIVKMQGFKPFLDVKEGEIYDDKAYLSSVKERIAHLEKELEAERAKLNE
ncbi:hypothetical protein [Macrococcus equipercicus]|uniref:Uncharacterized protein n=1 Tax=Macrococcus equipercicus TaxID=69967 RepID=A0A9Q9BQD2_9STAP|nr:hypothetical protein [Macrococcus equipercicus]UTH14775.1 hypothetical protein KFV11_05345 [Macrococcus equipercicus]